MVQVGLQTNSSQVKLSKPVSSSKAQSGVWKPLYKYKWGEERRTKHTSRFSKVTQASQAYGGWGVIIYSAISRNNRMKWRAEKFCWRSGNASWHGLMFPGPSPLRLRRYRVRSRMTQQSQRVGPAKTAAQQRGDEPARSMELKFQLWLPPWAAADAQTWILMWTFLGAAPCGRGGLGGQVWLFHSNSMNTAILKRWAGGGKAIFEISS